MTNDQERLIKAAMLLDVAMPYFEREAAKEKRQYEMEGGTLRPITCQQRLEAVREFIADVADELRAPL